MCRVPAPVFLIIFLEKVFLVIFLETSLSHYLPKKIFLFLFLRTFSPDPRSEGEPPLKELWSTGDDSVSELQRHNPLVGGDRHSSRNQI